MSQNGYAKQLQLWLEGPVGNYMVILRDIGYDLSPYPRMSKQVFNDKQQQKLKDFEMFIIVGINYILYQTNMVY